MLRLLRKFSKFSRHEKFKSIIIIYIIVNLGVLFSIYGFYLFIPAIVPDEEDFTPEGARMEIQNRTKAASIGQNFEMSRYNIGFDLLNFGGIFLLIGSLAYNYLESKTTRSDSKSFRLKEYKLHKKGWFKGNILEWLCMILFFFAFFTFFYDIFVYIVILSFTVGVIGFTIRKIYKGRVFNKKSSPKEA